jgi:intracellular multiplication protein IcmC
MDQFLNIFANLAPSLVQVQKLLIGAAYIIGLSLIIRGLMALKQVGEHRSHMSQQHSLKEPGLYILSGAFLLFFPTGMKIFLSTVFGSDNIMSYSAIQSSNPFINSLFGASGQFGQDIVIFIQVVGIISFIRGWMLIAKSSSQGGHQQGGIGKGLMHIIGGILAINVVQTLNIINNTLYGG